MSLRSQSTKHGILAMEYFFGRKENQENLRMSFGVTSNRPVLILLSLTVLVALEIWEYTLLQGGSSIYDLFRNNMEDRIIDDFRPLRSFIGVTREQFLALLNAFYFDGGSMTQFYQNGIRWLEGLEGWRFSCSALPMLVGVFWYVTACRESRPRQAYIQLENRTRKIVLTMFAIHCIGPLLYFIFSPTTLMVDTNSVYKLTCEKTWAMYTAGSDSFTRQVLAGFPNSTSDYDVFFQSPDTQQWFFVDQFEWLAANPVREGFVWQDACVAGEPGWLDDYIGQLSLFVQDLVTIFNHQGGSAAQIVRMEQIDTTYTFTLFVDPSVAQALHIGAENIESNFSIVSTFLAFAEVIPTTLALLVGMGSAALRRKAVFPEDVIAGRVAVFVFIVSYPFILGSAAMIVHIAEDLTLQIPLVLWVLVYGGVLSYFGWCVRKSRPAAQYKTKFKRIEKMFEITTWTLMIVPATVLVFMFADSKLVQNSGLKSLTSEILVIWISRIYVSFITKSLIAALAGRMLFEDIFTQLLKQYARMHEQGNYYIAHKGSDSSSIQSDTDSDSVTWHDTGSDSDTESGSDEGSNVQIDIPDSALQTTKSKERKHIQFSKGTKEQQPRPHKRPRVLKEEPTKAELGAQYLVVKGEDGTTVESFNKPYYAWRRWMLLVAAGASAIKLCLVLISTVQYFKDQNFLETFVEEEVEDILRTIFPTYLGVILQGEPWEATILLTVFPLEAYTEGVIIALKASRIIALCLTFTTLVVLTVLTTMNLPGKTRRKLLRGVWFLNVMFPFLVTMGLPFSSLVKTGQLKTDMCETLLQACCKDPFRTLMNLDRTAISHSPYVADVNGTVALQQDLLSVVQPVSEATAISACMNINNAWDVLSRVDFVISQPLYAKIQTDLSTAAELGADPLIMFNLASLDVEAHIVVFALSQTFYQLMITIEGRIERAARLFFGLSAFSAVVPAILSLLGGIERGCVKIKSLMPQEPCSGYLSFYTPLIAMTFLIGVVASVIRIMGNTWVQIGLVIFLSSYLSAYLGSATLKTSTVSRSEIVKTARRRSILSVSIKAIAATSVVTGLVVSLDYFKFDIMSAGTLDQILRGSSFLTSFAVSYFITTYIGADVVYQEIHRMEKEMQIVARDTRHKMTSSESNDFSEDSE